MYFYSETSDSEVDSYRSNRSRSRRSSSRTSTQPYPPQWQQQWQPAPQWPFWTLWAYHQSVGQAYGPCSRAASVSSTSAVPPLMPPPLAPPSDRSVPQRNMAPPSQTTAPTGTLLPTPQAPSSTPRRLVSTPVPAAVPHPEPALAAQPEYRVPQALVEGEGVDEGPLQGISSSSSPDEAVAGTSAAPALEDNRILQQLLTRAVQSLLIQTEEIEVDTDLVIDILTPSGPSRVALPLIKTITDTTRTLWQTLASLAPTAKRTERRYFVPTKGYEHLYTHPSPDSLVVDAANQRQRQGFQGATPKNREAKKLDLFGPKVYSTGGLQLRIANQQAIVSRYGHNMCSALSRFADLLPQESRTEFSALVEEGRLITWASLQAALDAADSASCMLATGLVMRRGAWLQVSGLPHEVQQMIQDLPFEGPTLFSEKTDKRLHSLKDSWTTLRSLGLHTPVT
ncbi:uncharacterized protein LOC101949407 isoform X1 [Chrysemys picta bellii]|uniref:uncharacterized protein LOC101949407 isoform X1 n=1 Tax=Chrysemys picta bellii TaxID=8478 RepID=UPI0032B14016